eukprot:gene3281-3498_t
MARHRPQDNDLRSPSILSVRADESDSLTDVRVSIVTFRKLDKLLNSCPTISDLADALTEFLPFKIPILPSHALYEEKYPSVFEIGSSECEVEDHNWQKILKTFIPSLIVYADQHDSSSLTYRRPNITMMHRDAIVLKVESRLEETDLSKAEAELISKFQGNAYHLFPYPSYSIIGIVTSSTVAKIFRITYDPQSNTYCSNPLSNNSEYRIEHEEHRVQFLVDIIKLSRWINQVTRPVKSFHLVPYRRTRTTNQHFVTWNGISIIKEFRHNLSAFPLID